MGCGTRVSWRLVMEDGVGGVRGLANRGKLRMWHLQCEGPRLGGEGRTTKGL
jgi:hypothetical protein